jgi:hypothetical protein
MGERSQFLSADCPLSVSTKLSWQGIHGQFTKVSARVDGFSSSGVERNHSSMNRLDRLESAEFKLVRDATKVFAEILSQRDTEPSRRHPPLGNDVLAQQRDDDGPTAENDGASQVHVGEVGQDAAQDHDDDEGDEEEADD